MAPETGLAQACKNGRIPAELFCDLIFLKPMRTHVLTKGDYVVLTPINEEDIQRGDVLAIEQIAEVDYLEPGDFLTTRGTTGPISGNVFISMSRDYPVLMEGDRIGEPTCPIPVYDTVSKYFTGKPSPTRSH